MSRPSVPNRVARELRQESGFGCCKCGHPIYDYQHIIPYSSEQHFRVEDMVLLCPNHHREATLGAMSQAEQRSYKSNPYNIRHGFAKGALSISQSALLLQLGSVFMVGDGIFLEIDDHSILRIGLSSEGILRISVSLYDKEDNLLVNILENEWIAGDPLPWDLEFGVRWLVLRERRRHISLYVDARRFPISLRGQLWYRGHQFKINKAGINFGGERAEGSFQHLGLVAQRIKLNTTGEMSIIPDERFGGGLIVSQPTPAALLTECLKAWQWLRYPNLILRTIPRE